MKLFYKEKKKNGRRILYLCGIKIFSYKRQKKLSSSQQPQIVEDWIEQARQSGVKIGKNCHFISMPNFGSEPYFITLGDNVKISFDVTFLTHDGGIWLCKNKEHSKLGRIYVGNNVFIGCKAILMPGVTIGDNCIIGAGSVVTKSGPSGEIWAGNPAHFIKKTQDYLKDVALLNQTDEQKHLLAMVNKIRENETERQKDE